MHTYVHTFIHAYIRTYIHTYMHKYVRTYVHTYIRTYIHTYIRTYMHTYERTYIHACIRTYIHTCIRTYVRIYIHTDRQTESRKAFFSYFQRGKNSELHFWSDIGPIGSECALDNCLSILWHLQFPSVRSVNVRLIHSNKPLQLHPVHCTFHTILIKFCYRNL
jgi:hypothetical protein